MNKPHSVYTIDRSPGNMAHDADGNPDHPYMAHDADRSADDPYMAADTKVVQPHASTRPGADSPPITSIATRFGAAAQHYDAHAHVQREVAVRLADKIADLPRPARPKVLEIGCGTGLLTQALAQRLGAADWTITDISPQMLAVAQSGPALPGTARFQVVDGEHPDSLNGGYDIVCSSLAVQWFTDLNNGLARLSGLLKPGGYLVVATLAQETFHEWRTAHQALGLTPATPSYPTNHLIGASLTDMCGGVHSEPYVYRHENGLAFLRDLKHIGATTPAPGHIPLSARQLRQVLQQFDRSGATSTYQVAYGIWKKP